MPTKYSEPTRLLGAGHQRDLEVIEAVGDTIPGDLRVVRWCKVCGAVVIEIEASGCQNWGGK